MTRPGTDDGGSPTDSRDDANAAAVLNDAEPSPGGGGLRGGGSSGGGVGATESAVAGEQGGRTAATPIEPGVDADLSAAALEAAARAAHDDRDGGAR